MKKVIVCALLLAATLGIVLAFGNRQIDTADPDCYLRVHIRANSNSDADQRVKYEVRDEVVRYLTPIVADCGTKREAMRRIGEELGTVERIADGTLKANGYGYGARASLREESFPTRVYENATLEAGVYDALILELGTGKGDNWWCVVYPPLCFTAGNGNVVYKSKIAEIIRSFFR